jgi:glutamine---fructose-6-phosphate transaminase (isomerizing)
MCGIVGIISKNKIITPLLNGLERLEYRGYDSAGVAVIENGKLLSNKSVGNVGKLKEVINKEPLDGTIGIAHTRWATHGGVTKENAHPHLSQDEIALVHNGIIENHATLRKSLINDGYNFRSDTDTEVVVHLLHQQREKHSSLRHSVQATTALLQGAYGIVTFEVNTPHTLIVARSGSPMVIGIGHDAHYVASDQMSLRTYTNQFVYLEEGDVAELRSDALTIWDKNGEQVERTRVIDQQDCDDGDKGDFDHYMQKEMMEQPSILNALIHRYFEGGRPSNELIACQNALESAEHIHIVACGTSFHAGLVAKYWFEQYAKIGCTVEIASEYRYRDVFVPDNTVFVCVSQSGETADTLAALRKANTDRYLTSIAICNVSTSSMVREAKQALMTHAGVEIGVASTKAFTTQLVAFLGLVFAGVVAQQGQESKTAKTLLSSLMAIPAQCEEALALEPQIKQWAPTFREIFASIFLGRGVQCPIAMEGALKLKELSYIHAEAYAAGELKHGPLALVDKTLPIVVNAPFDGVMEKLCANLEEVSARGGNMYIFADPRAALPTTAENVALMPKVDEITAPIVYILPLQLLAYHVALVKGANVDQPRNLAKSVTVE